MTASSLNYQTVLSVIDNCSIIALSESVLWVFALGHFKFVFKMPTEVHGNGHTVNQRQLQVSWNRLWLGVIMEERIFELEVEG